MPPPHHPNGLQQDAPPSAPVSGHVWLLKFAPQRWYVKPVGVVLPVKPPHSVGVTGLHVMNSKYRARPPHEASPCSRVLSTKPTRLGAEPLVSVTEGQELPHVHRGDEIGGGRGGGVVAPHVAAAGTYANVSVPEASIESLNQRHS